MKSLSVLKARVGRIRDRAVARRRRPTPTTSETRQELDRVLADLDARMAAASDQGRDLPTYPVADDEPLKVELDRVLAVLNRQSDSPPAEDTTATSESAPSVGHLTPSTTEQGCSTNG